MASADLFGPHPVRDQEVRRPALDVVAPFGHEEVTAAIREPGRLDDADPCARAPDHGLIVAVAASLGVVERAEPLVGGGEALEEGAAEEEPSPLPAVEPGDRFTQGRRRFRRLSFAAPACCRS